jgi:uncharacterized membrane protein YbjE (DUF340 family)
MHLTGTMLLFWAAGLTGHIVLLAVLLTRHRAAEFPIFTTLIAMNIVDAVALYEIALHGSKHTYFLAYFASGIIDLVLQLAVTYELASHIFCPTGRWAPDVRNGFLMLVLVSLVVAVGLAWMPSPPERTLLGRWLDRGNLFSSALQCELFVGMLAFSATASLPWKTHVARIAQGLGFYSLVGMLTEAGHNVLPRNTGLYETLSYVRMTTYLACGSYWIVMLWLNAPAMQELPEAMRHQLFTLQRGLAYDLRKLRALKR